MQEKAKLVEEVHKEFYDYFDQIVKEAKCKWLCFAYLRDVVHTLRLAI